MSQATHFLLAILDFNSKESPWNVKKGGYSYNLHTTVDGMAKRPIGSPKATEPSLLPAAKRRINFGGMDVVRPTADHRAPQLRGTTGINCLSHTLFSIITMGGQPPTL